MDASGATARGVTNPPLEVVETLLNAVFVQPQTVAGKPSGMLMTWTPSGPWTVPLSAPELQAGEFNPVASKSNVPELSRKIGPPWPFRHAPCELNPEISTCSVTTNEMFQSNRVELNVAIVPINCKEVTAIPPGLTVPGPFPPLQPSPVTLTVKEYAPVPVTGSDCPFKQAPNLPAAKPENVT